MKIPSTWLRTILPLILRPTLVGGLLVLGLNAFSADANTETAWCNGQNKRDVFAEYFPTAQARSNIFGEYYPNGQLIQNIFGMYYPNGQIIQNTFGSYYPNGQLTKNIFGSYYPNGQVTQNLFGCYRVDGSPANPCVEVIRGSFKVGDFKMRFHMDVATGAVSHLSFISEKEYAPEKSIRSKFELNQSGTGPLVKNFTAVCRDKPKGDDSEWEVDSQ